MSETPHILLASSSPYRRSLLERLQLPFETCSPDIDERRLGDEPVEQLVTRLAAAKTLAVANRYPEALIIGSDQVAALGDNVLGKPGNRDNAIRQLQSMRSASVDFVTGLCLLNAGTRRQQIRTVHFRVIFRDYSDAEIERYLDRDQPYDCAGSFKSEQLGISLIERMQGEDPSALMGLPLIELSKMLRDEFVAVP